MKEDHSLTDGVGTPTVSDAWCPGRTDFGHDRLHAGAPGVHPSPPCADTNVGSGSND